jgi:WD40 repeat protein
MSTDAPPQVGNPYVGPTSFRLGDPLYGRDREREDLLDLLIAERIVLFYSPSGAGKTSLIQAALVPALREAGFEVLPVIRVTHALEPRPGMPTPHNRYVLGTLLSLEEGVPPEKQRPVTELAGLTLSEYMDAYADRDDRPGNEVLIFDQFEEVLTADPTDEVAKHYFFRELGEMLRDRGHWALFSMREDFLAALDPYLRHVPTRFRSTFRLDLLSVPEALDAMRLPARRAGVDFIEEAADQLVDDLRRVRVQRPGGETEDAFGTYVEPVQLQVACRLLWSTLPPDASRITRADVEALGDVDRALADYYADRVRTIADETGVREATIRDWFEDRLITPQGLRGQVLEGPEVPGQTGRVVLARLVDAHLVRAEARRQATWYELAHDRLIEPVRRDNTAWRAQHMTSFERAARLWVDEGKPDRLLLLGPDLAAAEKDSVVLDGALKAREHDFLEASRRADEQRHRDAQSAAMLRRSARRLWIAVGVVTLLAMATLLALSRSRDAEGRAKDQEVASRLLLAAQRNLDADQDVAASLAVSGAEKYGPAGLPEHAREVMYLAAESPVSRVLRGQQGPTKAANISLDGTTVVTAGPDDIQVWDRKTGQPAERLVLRDSETPNDVAVSGDGRTVVAGLDNGTLLAWTVGSRRAVRWDEGTGNVVTLALSPDGEHIASVGYSNRVQVWDLQGDHKFSVGDESSTSASSVAFSPDGSMLATGSDAPELVLWDAASGAEKGRLPLSGGAWSVTFGSDPDRLATITAGDVTVWDVPSGQAVYPPFTGDAEQFRSVDADLSRVLSVSFGYVWIYDLANGDWIAESTVPGAATWGAVFDVDPNRVFVAGWDISPAFWDIRPLNSFESVTASTVAEGGIFSAWSDGTLRIWNGDATDSGGRIITSGDAGDVHQLAADADGRRLAAVTASGQILVWDTETGAQLATLEPDAGVFTAVDLTADGTQLITGDSDGRVVLRETATGADVQEVVAPGSRAISQIEASPDGRSALVAFGPAAPGTEGTASDSPDGPEPLALIEHISGGNDPTELLLPETAASTDLGSRGSSSEAVTAAEFSRDGKEVTVGTSEGRVVAFDAGSGDPRWDPVVAHRGEIGDVTVTSGTGDLLVIGRPSLTTEGGGQEHQLVLLDPTQGRRIRQVPSDYDVVAAALPADGGHIALLASDGSTTQAPLEDAELVRLVRSKVIHDLTPNECEYYHLPPGC